MISEKFKTILEHRKGKNAMGLWCTARLILKDKPSDIVLIPVVIPRNGTYANLSKSFVSAMSLIDENEMAALALLYFKELNFAYPTSIILRSSILKGDTSCPPIEHVISVTSHVIKALSIDIMEAPLLMGDLNDLVKTIISIRLESGI